MSRRRVLRRAPGKATSRACGSYSPLTFSWSGDGGKAPQLARSIIGAEKATRVLASIFARLVRIDVTMEPHEVNGQPGAIFRDRGNKVLSTVTLDVLDGRSRRSAQRTTPTSSGTWVR